MLAKHSARLSRLATAMVLFAAVSLVAHAMVQNWEYVSWSDYISAAISLIIGIMGAFVSLRPPQRYHTVWLLAFIVFGAASVTISIKTIGENRRSEKKREAEALSERKAREARDQRILEILANNRDKPKDSTFEAIRELMKGAAARPLPVRAWLQVTKADVPSFHVVRIHLKNFGQAPAFKLTLHRRKWEYVTDNGKNVHLLYQTTSKVHEPQVPQGGETDITESFDKPEVTQFLKSRKDQKPYFVIRVSGVLNYFDTQHSTPHELTYCYEDAGFSRSNDMPIIYECTDGMVSK